MDPPLSSMRERLAAIFSSEAPSSSHPSNPAPHPARQRRGYTEKPTGDLLLEHIHAVHRERSDEERKLAIPSLCSFIQNTQYVLIF